MTTERNRTWTLLDAEQLHAERPRSFFIPTSDTRLSLGPGDQVKLLFEFGPADGGKTMKEVERMWVTIDRAASGSYRGTLDNEPMHPRSIKLGDRVEFEPRHIAAVFDPNPSVDPRAEAIVVRTLIQDDTITRPGYVYRDPPSRRELDGVAPMPDGTIDSGWQLFVGDETEDDLTVENATVSRLDWLVERYPDLAPLIVSNPRSGEWTWSEESNSYELIERDPAE